METIHSVRPLLAIAVSFFGTLLIIASQKTKPQGILDPPHCPFQIQHRLLNGSVRIEWPNPCLQFS